MKWTDEGFLLRIQPHSESNGIASFFTRSNGLVKGYVRINRKYPLQQGNLYHIHYKSRLSTQLGLLSIEPKENFAPLICAAMVSPLKLACMNGMRTLLLSSLTEHETAIEFYEKVHQHLEKICISENFGNYVIFENDLLSHCGFGLDLTRCAVTQIEENLMYVSPKTGRAVSQDVGHPYKDKLLKLPLPLYQLTHDVWINGDILDGLHLTGYFLNKMFEYHLHRRIPTERHHLLTLFSKRQSTLS